MKKQTTRRRMLISSVAMLLVAMVALGTATFAWFTTNTTATANGINVKTVEASDLQISDYKVEWGSSVAYGVSNQVLFPVSSATGSAWFNTTAASQNSYAKDSTATVTNVTSSYVGKGATVSGDVYYFQDQLNIKNAGDTTITDITISASPTWGSDSYLRVALVKLDTQTATTDATSFASSIYAADTTSYEAYNSTTPTTTAITPVGSSISINVGDLDSEECAYYALYVWYEGQDEDCKSANAGKVLEDITFTVSGTPSN